VFDLRRELKDKGRAEHGKQDGRTNRYALTAADMSFALEVVGDVYSEREAVTGAGKSEADGGFDIQSFRQP
jgi:hypothetical protein